MNIHNNMDACKKDIYFKQIKLMQLYIGIYKSPVYPINSVEIPKCEATT